ncbi:glutamate--cysteine ligase [soil metagenome]
MIDPASPFALDDDPLGQDFTVGVEEEFFLVDAETRLLRDDAEVVLGLARTPEGSVIDAELKRSQVETATPVCTTMGEVRTSVAALRRSLSEAAGSVGARLLASGTHPSAGWNEDGGMTQKAAYVALDDTYGLLAVEQAVCGCHVHVGVRDPELAIGVMNRIRRWLPVLVALTANSPFWMGHDTRYASYRTQVFHRWPMTGIPEHLADRAAYDELLGQLLATEAIDDPARLYWDVRPSARYPTLELRVADVVTTIDEAVMLAAIVRALVETLHADAAAEVAFEPPRPELLRTALWRATRFGLTGGLVDHDAMAVRPAPEVLGSLLQLVRPVLEQRGEWDEVSATITFVLRQGTGAARQLDAWAASEDLDAVIDRTATATVAGAI